MSVESLARVAEVVRAAGADGTTAQSVVSYLTNLLAQGTHSVPHTAAASTSVAPPVQRQFQVQAADGGWARGSANTLQDGALLPRVSGGNATINTPALQTGTDSGVADSHLQPSRSNVMAAGEAATATAAATTTSDRGNATAALSTSSGGSRSSGAAAAPSFGDQGTMPPPWAYGYQAPPPWWFQTPQGSSELKLPELTRTEHHLTFAGEKDAHSLLEFLREKETILHPYIKAGKLVWDRPADRIVVLTWLGSALAGTAKTWWNSTEYRVNQVTGQMEASLFWESLMSWDQVVAAFKSKWERAVNIASAQADFYQGTKQRPGEALHDFNARFDQAAERAKVTNPALLANTYWYGLQKHLRDEIGRHLHLSKGEAASSRASELSLQEMRDLAREVVLLSSLVRQSPYLGSGLPPPSQSTRSSMHAFDAAADDFDEDGGVPYEDHNQVHQEGLINTVNANGGRNRHNSYTYNHSMTVARGSGTSAGGTTKRRRVEQPVTAAGGGGRNRYHSPSPSSSSSSTPQRRASPAGKPPPYGSPDGRAGTGGNGGLTSEQVQRLQALRQKLSGILDKVPDGQLFARLQQQVCLLCGSNSHRVNACPSAPGVKREYPKGQARGGQ